MALENLIYASGVAEINDPNTSPEKRAQIVRNLHTVAAKLGKNLKADIGEHYTEPGPLTNLLNATRDNTDRM